ncbi:amino acid ABC transporter substrate-binding protein, partial [Klebsiella pneumoniae subsp. pneumoniae]
ASQLVVKIGVAKTGVTIDSVFQADPNKDNPELLKELKASLAQRVSDGSYRALLQKYNLQMPGADEISKALAGSL